MLQFILCRKIDTHIYTHTYIHLYDATEILIIYNLATQVKSMTRDSRVVAYCLADSEELKVNVENTKVRRIRQLPDYDETTSSRSVLITNLPMSNPTVETVSDLVKSSGGDIVLIRIIRPSKQFPVDLKKYLMKHPQVTPAVNIQLVVLCDAYSVILLNCL